MKKILCILLAVLTLASFSACSYLLPVDNIKYTELGIPLSERYPDTYKARCPWDMIIWEDRLYIGSGDYDANSGPVDIWCYDIKNKTWENSGTVDDEEVNRFCILDGKLIAPGIDSRKDWELGSFYCLEDNSWTEIRTLPGGVHNFDIVEYDGMIFAGLGVIEGEYPIALSRDGGKSFEQVKMYRDGALIDTTKNQYIRVYDLFVFEKELYATFLYGNDSMTYDLYRYENGVFVYENGVLGKIRHLRYSSKLIAQKAEFASQMFFVTGYLYATNDMKTFTRIVFPEDPAVYDICIKNDALYALCAKKSDDGKYKISVWKNESEDITNFKEQFNFYYNAPPLSFELQNGDFYIGMGDMHSQNENNGMILFVKLFE